MSPLMNRTCSKTGCENKISSQNKTGVCTPCQQGYPVGGGASKSAKRSSAPGSRPPDADDAVLERVETSSAKPKTPPKPKKVKEPESVPPGPVEEFFTLASALGLDGQGMLDDWCRDWVATTRARALGHVGQAPKPNGLDNAEIAADYEKAREQAEATES